MERVGKFIAWMAMDKRMLSNEDRGYQAVIAMVFAIAVGTIATTAVRLVQAVVK